MLFETVSELLEGRGPLTGSRRGPLAECAGRGGDCGVDIGLARRRDLGDHLARRGVDHLIGAVAARVPPSSADEVLSCAGRHGPNLGVLGARHARDSIGFTQSQRGFPCSARGSLHRFPARWGERCCSATGPCSPRTRAIPSRERSRSRGTGSRLSTTTRCSTAAEARRSSIWRADASCRDFAMGMRIHSGGASSSARCLSSVRDRLTSSSSG